MSRLRLCLVGSAFLAVVSVSSSTGQSAPPYGPSLARWLPARVERVYTALARGFSPGRAMGVVKSMSRAWRLPGNPAFEASQELISRRLAEAGFRAEANGNVHGRNVRTSGGRRFAGAQWYEEFAQNNPAWEPRSATIEFVELETNQRTLPRSKRGKSVILDLSRPLDKVSLCINSFSTSPGGVRAPLVFVGRGADPSDYAKVDVAGTIVLGQADTRRLFDMAVRQRGALGVLSDAAAAYTRQDETPDVVQWSGIPYDETLHAFGFKVSRRVVSLLKERLAAGPVTLKVVVATAFRVRPNRTLVAEIPGRGRPDERVVLVAHVQEPGANDNASGCATLLEMARALARGIERGAIAPPERTITFLWGDEIAASRQWLRADPARAGTVRHAFSLDMTGEDVSKTGGAFLIEKQPDPSAVWVRPSDPHTEWGRGTVASETLKGDLLNDVHLAVCQRRARDTGWVVKANPYEGGSDHSVFLASGIPALLDWHFTDRYYHTNLDTADKTSPAEMANVGIAVGTTAWLLASADDHDGAALARLLEEAAVARLALEARQSADAIAQAKGSDDAREREAAVYAAWQKWYVEALQSVLKLPVNEPSADLTGRVQEAADRVRTATPEWRRQGAIRNRRTSGGACPGSEPGCSDGSRDNRGK